SRTALPPGIGRTDWGIHLGGAVILRESKERHMAIAPHQVPTALPAVVVPNAFGGGGRIHRAVACVARTHPRPVALDQFVDRAPGDYTGFDRRAIRRSSDGAVCSGVF